MTRQNEELPRAKKGWLRDSLLALSSSALIWISFPPVDFGPAAWVALIPWLVLVARKTAWRAAGWSLLVGYLAFVPLLHWVRFVSSTGWLMLALYCAFYFGVGGLLAVWLRRRRLSFVLSLPAIFVTMELVRSFLFTGFSFYFLGHTQYRFIPVIQIADLAGVYGITFLLCLVNACLAELVLSRGALNRTNIASAATAMALVTGAFAYGAVRDRSANWTVGPRVMVVQGNASQELKHSPEAQEVDQMMADHVKLTKDAIRPDVDLVVWAETMFPMSINRLYDQEYRARIRERLAFGTFEHAEDRQEVADYLRHEEMAEAALRGMIASSRAHFLIGSETSEDNTDFYNSLYYLSPKAEVLGRYDKMHLVVFGEYTPLADTFPFLRTFRPPQMGEDLRPGLMPVLFKLPYDGSSMEFCATICYEDAESGQVRQSVRRGARFMVNSTNDGWFRDSAELDHHLAVCAFRAVENRIPVARCANTGVSAFIEPNGRIATRVTDSQGRYRLVTGTLTENLRLDSRRSLYTRWGDVFAYLASGAVPALIVIGLLRREA